MSLKHKIEYGWCYTDHKDGKLLHERDDYVFGDKYQAVIFNALEEHGFPIPEEEQVFRGLEHDLLFLDENALVIRIGHIDIDKMINPCILQPIGWESYNIVGDDKPLTMAIYPGIDLIYYVADRIDIDDAVEDLTRDMSRAGHFCEDTIYENFGAIELKSTDRVDYVPVVLDTENETNTPVKGMLKKIAKAMNKAEQLTTNKAEQLQIVMDDLYAGNKRLTPYLKAFNKHQALRVEFANAAQIGDKSLFEDLWDKCADIKIDPTDAEFPTWKCENGIYRREMTTMPNMSLLSPWAKEGANNAI